MTDLEKLDQLLNKVKKSPETEISNYWSSIADIFIAIGRAERNECAMTFYQWAEENAGQLSLKFYYAEFLLASSHFLSEQFEKALPLVIKAQKSFEEANEADGAAMCSLIMGASYRSLGNFDLALKSLLGPFEHFKKSEKYLIFLEAACHDLANVNFELHNYEEALSLFRLQYESSLKIGNDFFKLYALHGIGKVYIQLNKFPEAREYLEKALRIAEELNNPAYISNSLTELANFNFRFGNLKEAEKLHYQALSIREQNKFIGAAATNCIYLGEIHLLESDYEKALLIVNKGLLFAEQIKVKLKMYQLHLLLSKIYRSKNELEKSIYHYEAFHDLKEKVQQEDNARRLTDARLVFEAEHTKKENVIIKKQKEEIQEKNFQLHETIDQLKQAHEIVSREKKRSEDLLLNILPAETAEELKDTGTTKAKYFDEVTILFTDFKDFTTVSEQLSPQELVNKINYCYSSFDEIITRHGIEKIKTIGDSYMCAGGLPVANKTNAVDVVLAAIEIRDFMLKEKQKHETEGKPFFEIRIGCNTGHVIAGIVGIKKFAYDIWGDAVNIASRIESSGEVGKVNISGSTYQLVKDKFNCTPRGKIEAKNKGVIDMYFVDDTK